MKQIMKKFFIVLLAAITVITITACGKSNKKKKKDYVVSPNLNYDEYVENDGMFDGAELHEIELTNPDAYSNAFMDVEPDFTIHLQAKGAYLTCSEVNNSVVIRNAGGEAEEILVQELVTGDFCGYSLSAEGGFKNGRAYTASIEDAPNLLFYGKDESVRKIVFSVKDVDKEICTVKKDYKTYDIKKITYFSGFGDFDTYLFFEGKFDSQVGDIVIFDGADDGEKIYIKVKKIEKNKSTYKIYYEAPTGEELFSELDTHFNQKEVNLEECLYLKTKEELVAQIKESQLAEEYIAYAAYAYNFEDEIMKASKDFWDNVFIDISAKVSGNTLNIKVSLSYTFTTQKGWRVILFVNYKYTETYTTSGGIAFETFWGIPYHVNINFGLSSNVTHAIEFRGCLANPKFPESWKKATAKKAEDFNQEDAEHSVKEIRKLWGAEGENMDYMNNQISGDTFMLGLGYITFHFGYVSIDFELFLCIKNQLNVTFGIGYTYNYTKTIVSYSSSADRGDTATSPSKVSTHIINGSYVGKYSAEFYGKFRVSIYITGLKWMVYLYLDFDAGLYFDDRGMASFTWDLTNNKFNVDGGIYVECGFFFRITLGVNILGLVNPNITLADGKFPIFMFDFSTCITQRGSTDTVEISDKNIEVSKTMLLYYEVFDYNNLNTVTKSFNPTDECVYFKSGLSTKSSYKIFSNFKSDNPQIRVVGDYIVVDDSVGAEAEATISFTYDSGLNKHEDSIKVHYRAKTAKNVYFDNKLQKAYLPGEKVIFPDTVEDRPGYIFKGYKVNNTFIDQMDDYIVGNEDVYFESYYMEDISFTINFYDHLGNLIVSCQVKNGSEIPYPNYTPSDDYEFICWDKDVKYAGVDLDIYAICARKGEII